MPDVIQNLLRTSFNRILPILFIGYCAFFLSDSAWTVEDTEKSIYDRIKSLQKRSEESKKEVEEGKKKLKKMEQDKQNVLKNLRRTTQDIEKLHRNLNKIKREENSLTGEIKSAEKRLDKADQNLKTHSDEYARRLRSMYKRQRISMLEMFYRVGSISSMMRGLKMFTVLAQEDVKVLETIRQQKRTIETSMKEITAALDAQRSLAKRQKRQELSLEKTRQERQALLDEIKRDEELLKQAIVQQQKDYENTQAEIEKLLSKIARDVKKREFQDSISDELKKYNFASRKGKLSWPVNGRVVGSFGVITDPKTKTKIINRGVEIETNHGEPVCAIGSGVVVMIQFFRGYGNFVMIFHPPNFYTIYAHLSDILINVDTEVREGDIIGLSGSTGLIDDSKSRLLLEVLNGKKPENPLSWLKPDRRRTSS